MPNKQIIMRDGLSRVTKNTVFISIEKIIEVLVSIATVAIVARYLSIELVGQYIFIVTVVGFLLMGSYAGLERILVRNISREKERTRDYLHGAITARNVMFVGILGMLGIILFFMNFDKISLIATGIFIVSEFLSYQGLTYMAVFKAYERMEYNTVITFITKIITLGATVFVVYFDMGFVSIFLAISAGNFFKSTTSFFLFKKLKFYHQARSSTLNNSWKELLRESYVIALTTILAVVCVRMEVFILKAFSTLKDVAFFQVSHNIIMQFQIIPMAAISALAPVLSREMSLTKGINKNLIEKLLTTLLCVGFPVTILGFYCASDIVHFIYGDKYLQAAISLKILISSSVFIILFYLFETLLIAVNRQNFIGYGWMLCFIVNLVLGLLLVPYFGYIGASIAVALAYTALCVFLCFSLIGFVPVKISIQATVRIFTSVSVMIAYLCFSPLNTNNSLALVIANAFIALVLYLGTYFARDFFARNEIKVLVQEIPRWLYWYPFRYFIQSLPGNTGYLCVKKMGLLSYILLSGKKADIENGLKLFFNGEPNQEIQTIVRRTFEERAFSAIDVFYYPRLTKDNINDIVEYEGLEYLDDALQQGRGVILMHGHFCNEEFLMPAMGHKGYPMNQIGSRWAPPSVNGKFGWIPTMIRKKAFQLRIGYREKLPVVFHYIDKSLRSAYQCLQNNEVLLVAADGREGKKWIQVSFLGRIYSFSPGVFQIARRTGAVVLPTFLIRKENYSTFKVVVGKAFPVGDDDAVNIQNFVNILESYIRNYPWLYAKVYLLKDSF